MSNERGNCIECGNELTVVDDDPNRTCGATCKRCLAEQNHDFDAEPDVQFSRSGERMGAPSLQDSGAPKYIRDALKRFKPLPQRQDGVNDQLQDLRIIANHFGLYDAADAIKALLNK
ncbi:MULTISPECIES: hypothetical protein [Pseudomonas]|uniref:hypothetical protein n=1 Tax=Pseudomonas TaxID=286 RepID=UPI000F027C39|nr:MULTISPECIES: hypothetical protein [Pseudomonas]MBD8681715.1 hypothetical protein [Pseudomonas sp. CFBP 13719]